MIYGRRDEHTKVGLIDVGEKRMPPSISTSPCGQFLAMSRTEKGDIEYGRHCTSASCCLSSSDVKGTSSYCDSFLSQRDNDGMNSASFPAANSYCAVRKYRERRTW